MTIDEIITALEYNRGSFPTEAVTHAQANAAGLTPRLLEELALVAENPAHVLNKDESYFLHIYAMFLLARWREFRAFPLLVKIFSGDPDDCYEMVDDLITQDLAAIFASVYDGKFELLDQLVRDTSTCQWVRSAAMESLLVLFLEGSLGREEVKNHYQTWFRHYLELGLLDDYAPTSLVVNCCDLGYREMLPEIEQAHQQGLVDPKSIRWQEVLAELKGPEAGERESYKIERHRFVQDVISAMEWWACFQSDNDGDEEWGFDDGVFNPAPEPYIAPPKVGRNEPCPCGSGKKYKKCCFAN